MTAPTRPAVPSMPYATYIPGRSPRFKPHRTIVHAKRAVLIHHNDCFDRDMVLYKAGTNGQYMPWIIVKEGTRRQDYTALANEQQSYIDKVRELERLAGQYNEMAADLHKLAIRINHLSQAIYG